jgi:hypothetical protein
MVTKAEFLAANRRAAARTRRGPNIVKARYDGRSRRIVLELDSRVLIAFAPADVEGLDSATHEELRQIEITPSRQGIYLPALDADLSLPSLLHGVLGSRQWMAARLGAAGGSVRSAAKSAAARANGKLGGRPRKAIV